MRILERNCSGPFGRWMAARGWAGFTLPLPFIGCAIFYWVLPGEEPDPRVRKHELVHCAQRIRYGFLGFVARYAWGLIRYGYNSPLEQEAYAEEWKEPDATQKRIV